MTRLFLTTALVMGLAVPPCRQTRRGRKLTDKQELNYWLLDALKSLDPHKNTDREGSDALRQLFEGLLNEDEDRRHGAGRRRDLEISPTKDLVFHLRDAKWSNGDPVKAGDFVYGWRRLVDPATASEYAWFMELMNVENAPAIVKGEKSPTELGIKAIDDKTLEVKLTTPTPHLLKTLAHPSTFPVPQRWSRPKATTGPAGQAGRSNGAYKLDSHDLGVQAVLSRNENYWDNANTVPEHRALHHRERPEYRPDALSGGRAGLDGPHPAGQFPRLQRNIPIRRSRCRMPAPTPIFQPVGQKGRRR